MMENEIGAFWEGVGTTIIGAVPGEASGILLYLECEPGVSGGTLYRDGGNDLEQIGSPTGLFMEIYWHWEALDPPDRWAAVHYMIDDGRFRVKFDFPDPPWDENEDVIEAYNRRLAAARHARFGDKPVRPMTDTDWDRFIGKSQ